MSIDDQSLRAICFLAIKVRKSTPGAGPWDEHGLMTNLRKIQNRNLHMTIEHVMRHAADATAKSPGVIVGSFTPKPPKDDRVLLPPKRQEQCLDCGRHLDGCLCGGRVRARERGDVAAGVALVRASLKAGGL